MSRVVAAEIWTVRVPLKRPFYMSLESYRESSEIVVVLRADDGNQGVGQAHGRPLQDIESVLRQTIPKHVLGRGVMETTAVWEDLWQELHAPDDEATTVVAGQPHFGAGARPPWIAAMAAIDVALWDLKSRTLGVPLYALLGGAPHRVPVYATTGYYVRSDGRDDPAVLVDDVSRCVDLGFDAVKVKVGRPDVATDVTRLRRLRQAFPDLCIRVDANAAWSFEEACDFVRRSDELNLDWIEEPLRWYYPPSMLARVAALTRVPMASGEGELTRWGCAQLLEQSKIRILQFDATRGGGITEWLRVCQVAEAAGVAMAPHHDPYVHGPLLCAIPNGMCLETMPDLERDPLYGELFEVHPAIRQGRFEPSQAPGLGIALNREALARWSARREVVSAG